MLQYISKQTSNSLFFLQVRAVGTLLQMAGARLSFKRACVVCNTTATSVVAHAPSSNALTLKTSHSDTPLLPLDSHVMRFVTSSFCAGAHSSGCTTQRFVGFIVFFYALLYRCGFVKPTGCAAYNVQLSVPFFFGIFLQQASASHHALIQCTQTEPRCNASNLERHLLDFFDVN